MRASLFLELLLIIEASFTLQKRLPGQDADELEDFDDNGRENA